MQQECCCCHCLLTRLLPGWWSAMCLHLLHHRWVMDHEADYRLMVEIYNALHRPGQVFAAEDVLKLLIDQPKLFEINAHIPRSGRIPETGSQKRRHMSRHLL